MRGHRGSTIRGASFCLLAAAACLAGCEGESRGPIVLEMKGRSLGLEDLRYESEIRHGAGEFESLTPEQRRAFLAAIGDKEVLLQLAREENRELTPRYESSLREALDGKLIRMLEAEVTAWVAQDTAGVEELLPAYRKEYLASWVMNPVDSVAAAARDQVLAGRPFAEVAAEYSMADSAAEKGGSMGWIHPTLIPLDHIEEIILGYEGPGQVSSIAKIPYGYSFFQIDGSRPFDLESDPVLHRGSLRMIRDLRVNKRLAEYADSLREAGGFAVREENLPLFTERIRAYWDTLMVDEGLKEMTASRLATPAWFFSEEDKRLALYTFEGNTVPIGRYLDGLADAPTALWPSAGDPEGLARQIRDRALLDKQLRIVRERGIDRSPEYLAFEKPTRERIWIEQYQQESIQPRVEVTDEEIAAFYEERRDSYVMGDKIRLNYVIFATRAEAREFYELVDGKIAEFWADQTVRLARQGKLVEHITMSPYYDYAEPLPEDLAPLLELGREASIKDVLPPVALPAGGWAVARVSYRELPGVKTLDQVQVGIRMILEKQKLEALLNQSIEEGRERLDLKLYPERLEEEADSVS